MRPSERITTEPTADTGATIDPERLVWAIGCGLWAVVLLGTVGYVFHGISAALLGGLLGLFFAYQFYHHGQPASVSRALGTAPPVYRGDIVDWRRLLDYEKFHFAGQLERDGHPEQAVTIYRHLVDQGFPSLAPYRRLAAIYRHRGAYRAEVDTLEQALARASAVSAHPSTDAAETRQELLRQRDRAQERFEKELSPTQGDLLE